MLSCLPGFLIAPLLVLSVILNTILWGSLALVMGIIRRLIPVLVVEKVMVKIIDGCITNYGRGCMFIVNLFNNVSYQIDIDDGLRRDGWYLMISNHLSWLDIPLIMSVSAGRIPAPKFFLKQELIWVPFLGLGAWAAGMPFMKRYSRAQIEKNPQLKGKDIETTKRACEQFRHIPTTIINFVEGTRYTEQKHQTKPNDYQQLLSPKAAGVAFTMAAMGDLFDSLLNVTIVYPDAEAKRIGAAKAAMMGKLKRVVIEVKIEPITDQLKGDYFNDETFKLSFQQWINELWRQKDNKISTYNEQLQ